MIISRVISDLKKIAPRFYVGEVIENGQQNGIHEPYYWIKEKGVTRILSKHSFKSNESLNLDCIQDLTDFPFENCEQSKTINAFGEEELKRVYKIPKNQILFSLCGNEGGEDTIFYNPVSKTFRKICERVFYGQKHLMSVATFNEDGQFVRGQCFSPGVKEHYEYYDMFSTKQPDKVITHYPDEVSAFAFRRKVKSEGRVVKYEIVKCIIERGFKAKLIKFARNVLKYFRYR